MSHCLTIKKPTDFFALLSGVLWLWLSCGVTFMSQGCFLLSTDQCDTLMVQISFSEEKLARMILTFLFSFIAH